MNVLLDTHTLLWWLDDNPTLSREAINIISDGKNVVFISAASIWEIRIKESIGKIDIPLNFKEILEKQPFEVLSITSEHAHAIKELPLIHRDPFDRMLITQGKIEKLAIITRDVIFSEYNINVIKA
ncbi:MAG TPA: type II toxin-antitoxin system VapC family toxin [Spirochaetota bacterium]|nr:type II toxin-antitoxin system VapC family toxin [Spirochaetota bacterium]